MLRFILGGTLYLVPTFIGITIIAFGFIRCCRAIRCC
jgi:dipeptide transport system permease protein